MHIPPLFSVIINCHNGEEFLQEAFDSIWSQTFQDYEVIYWDNQSTDKSYQIAYSQKKSNLRCIKSEKFTSLGEARNQAVEKAKGVWICFLDSDDIWKPEKLKIQADIIANNPDYGIIYSNFDHIDQNSNLIKSNCMENSELHGGEILNKLLKNNFIGILTAAVRKKDFLDVGGIHSSLSVREDHYLFLKLAKITKAYAVQKSECQYRLHSKNYSKDRFKSYKEAILINREFNLICKRKAFYLNLKLYLYKFRYRFFSSNLNIRKKFNNGKQIYIWGTGAFAMETLRFLSEMGIIIKGAFDNNKKKQKTQFNGVDITAPPTHREEFRNKFIVIATSFFPDIKKQLLTIGLKDKRDFCNFEYLDLNQLPNEKTFFGNIYTDTVK